MLFKRAESTDNPRPVRPMKEAVEAAIQKKLDKEAREDSPAPGLAVQERQESVVKVSSWDFYEKVAQARDRLRFGRKLRAASKKQCPLSQ